MLFIKCILPRSEQNQGSYKLPIELYERRPVCARAPIVASDQCAHNSWSTVLYRVITVQGSNKSLQFERSYFMCRALHSGLLAHSSFINYELCERGFEQLLWSAHINKWKYCSHCIAAQSRLDLIRFIH